MAPAFACSRVEPVGETEPIDSARQLTTFPNRGRGEFIDVGVLVWPVFVAFMAGRSQTDLKP